jgi:hypothetical protein
MHVIQWPLRTTWSKMHGNKLIDVSIIQFENFQSSKNPSCVS